MAQHTALSHNSTEILIRPATLNDIELIRDMHQRSSKGSLFYRYLRLYIPSRREIETFCHLDDSKGAAFVATIKDEAGEVVVGNAYYLIDSEHPSVAEPAILIEDGFQGQGLGRRLWGRLIQYALTRGISTFNVNVHPSNQRMWYLIKNSGFPFETKMSYGLQEVRIMLRPEHARQYSLPYQHN